MQRKGCGFPAELWASLNIVLRKHVYSPQVQLIDTMHCMLNKISVPVRIDRDGNFAFSLDMFVKHPKWKMTERVSKRLILYVHRIRWAIETAIGSEFSLCAS